MKEVYLQYKLLHIYPLQLFLKLYIYKVFFKYGLTKNIRNRLYYIPYDVEILELIELNKYDAVYKERELLEKVTSYTPLTKFGGHTECFIL